MKRSGLKGLVAGSWSMAALTVGLGILGPLFAAVASSVEPIEPLRPMAFLAGHCWKGEFPGGKQTDEHCFQWMLGGRAMRDSHTVRAPGRPDYIGETTYYWEPGTRTLEYLYIENLGGVARGTVESVAGGLNFPATEFHSEGETLTYRSRWSRISDDTYEAFSEAKTPDGWRPMFKLTMKRM